jgi:hypothetical protein
LQIVQRSVSLPSWCASAPAELYVGVALGAAQLPSNLLMPYLHFWIVLVLALEFVVSGFLKPLFYRGQHLRTERAWRGSRGRGNDFIHTANFRDKVATISFYLQDESPIKPVLPCSSCRWHI